MTRRHSVPCKDIQICFQVTSILLAAVPVEPIQHNVKKRLIFFDEMTFRDVKKGKYIYQLLYIYIYIYIYIYTY